MSANDPNLLDSLCHPQRTVNMCKTGTGPCTQNAAGFTDMGDRLALSQYFIQMWQGVGSFLANFRILI